MVTRSFFALVAALGVFTSSVAAATYQSGAKIPAGSTFRCVLAHNVDSRTMKPGSTFKLTVDDPYVPVLTGAEIHGHVTDVQGPGGVDRARIGFVFDYIKFNDKKKAPIHAQIVSKYVTYTNTAEAKHERDKFNLPPVPQGQVTPGPIAWQLTFRQGSKNPSVTPPPVGLSSGYVYAQESNENIVIPAGTPVTIKLTQDLTVQ